ncbi:hypothetical protein C2S52_010394 [Perilla frutescens var. hirtella]|nr:hypothetical protein C2S52_010394 [Perilla frutescens var. hirtella]KAH6817242.1 hypothetical protein C2S51_000845 [Perilla frutescens var. frutescens]
MLTLRHARQSRSLLSPPSAATATTTVVLSSTASDPSFHNPSTSHLSLSPGTNGSNLALYFREWFMSRKAPLYDSIFETLRTHDGASSDAALSRFNLRLSQTLVLEVLNYNRKDVLSCLKFFDWAGRQQGFFHTRATFNAIFRVITKAKMTDLMLDFLQNYAKYSYNGKTMYHDILVIGYAIAGQCETALAVFGRMRFRGHDLDPVAYNVLLNSLVEEGHFDFAESVVKEIKIRGRVGHVTHSIIMKSLCKQNELERAEEYLRGLLNDDRAKVNGFAVSIFVTALCKSNQFRRASMFIEEFKGLGLDMMEGAYSAWIGGLVKAGKTDHALEFFKDKQGVEEYVPDVFRFNALICRLLRENRLEEVYDLLIEMNKHGVVPDDVTMNAVLCFLCKAGMMETATGLYDSRVEFGLSVNRMAYNYLINTLLGEASVEESYRVLKNSLEQGYFPGERTLSIVADALCREGKLDKMKELVKFVLDQNFVCNDFIYDKFISAFCRFDRVEEGYLLHDLLTKLNKTSRKFAYYSLIHGFCRSNRADLAARLLIEMQESGYRPSRRLFRAVICCICKMHKPENQFFRLLEMQLARSQLSHSVTYEIFIDGAGHALKPELAFQVYEMMRRSGLIPTLTPTILLLQTYLKSRKVSHAVQLFCELSMRWGKRKLWHVMIIGLCKIKEPDYASQMLENMQLAGKIPSIQCYEELIKLYCDLGQYHDAVVLLNDMTRIGRHISSFIGNVFLLHALKGRELYDAWASSSARLNLTPTSWMLGHLIGIFSGCIEGNHLDEDIETLVQQCFEIDLYTYNMMLRRLRVKGIDYAYRLFHGLREKGFEPNRWTYDTIIHGLAREGRDAEARIWMNEMLARGFGDKPTQKCLA